jgi:hypothetical protein
LATKDFPRWRGDRTFGEDPGGHLVEQRLKQVMVGLGDHRDIHRCVLQRLGGEEPSETEPMITTWWRCFMLSFMAIVLD